MNEKSGIFIFTRDRPHVLRQSLHLIKDVSHKIIIIDDSVSEVSRVKNQEIINASNHACIGKSDFLEFIKHHKIDLYAYSFLLRQMGDEDWNLGYARNFALVYGKAAGFENVLFMDDDIEVPCLLIIDELFGLLKDYDFTGAHIAGLVDDSVLGHVATNLDIFNERMLSGGFMAFNPDRIEHYFLNSYNEDWIWLFLQIRDKAHIQTGEVIQALGDPLDNYDSKIMFQEFGEIALDGVLDCNKQGHYESLCSISFWERMLKERNVYIENLFQAAKQNSNYSEIIDYVRSRSNDNFHAEIFKELFVKYFANLDLFKRLYNSLL